MGKAGSRASVDALENRRFLAADLTAAFVSETLGDSTVAGLVAKGRATVRVTNASSTDAVPNAVRATVQVVLRPTGGGNDIVIGQATNASFSSLGAGKTRNFTINLNTPATVPAGQFSLVAVVDSGNTIAEDNESNNTALATGGFVVQPATPDIALVSASASFTTKAGTGRVTVRNTGNVDFKGSVNIQFIATAAGQTDAVIGTASNVSVNMKKDQQRVLRTVPLALPPNPATGTAVWSVVARITPAITPADVNAANHQVTATGGVTTSAPGGPLGAAGFSDRYTLTMTERRNQFGVISEQGTLTDGLGRSGTWVIAFPPSVAHSGTPGNFSFIMEPATNFAGGARTWAAFFSKKPATVAGKTVIISTSKTGAFARLYNPAFGQDLYIRFA